MPFFLSLCLAVCAAPCASAARPAGPAVSIALEPLGFQPLQAQYLAAGASMFTLHFVDATHLLFTFNNRNLLQRLPDTQPDDSDRNVTALLVELPSGRVLARTEWRLRDHDQYLWSLGHGLFALRIRSRLTLIAPLTNLASGGAFHQVPLLEFSRRIGYISVSPDGKLLAVETAAPRLAPVAEATTPSAGGTAPAPGAGASLPPPAPTGPTPMTQTVAEDGGRPPVEIHFYRLDVKVNSSGHPHLFVGSSGAVRAYNLVHIPADADGFIDVTKESANVFLFDFQSHDGNRLQLAPFDTSCAPRPYLVSPTEFVAFGCYGAARQELGGFNLRGEQPWVQVFSSQHVAPYLATAPDAGRFVLSRVLNSNPNADAANLTPQDLTSQEVSVLQNHDGRVLLKLNAAPVQRAGQNFDISADGLHLAIVRTDNIEVYGLPPLTGKDHDAIKLLAASAPRGNDVPITLNVRAEKNASPDPHPGPAPAISTGVASQSSEPPAQPIHSPSPSDEVNARASSGSSAPATPPAAPASAAQSVPPPDAAVPEPPRPPPSLYDAEHPKDPKER